MEHPDWIFVDDITPFWRDEEEKDVKSIVIPDATLPGNKDLNPDFNAGFGGKYCYLYYHIGAATFTSLSFTMTSYDATSEYGRDMAQGTGGKYRYLIKAPGPSEYHISSVALWRLAKSSGPKTLEDAKKAGYDGITNDYNTDRGGDYLYIVWKNTESPDYAKPKK